MTIGLITIVGGLFLKWTMPPPLKNLSAENFFWSEKAHSKEKFNLLIIGDSRIYRGISAKIVIENIPGYSAKNLGFSSTGFNPDYFNFVDDRLDQESLIPIIIMGITPHSLTPNALKNSHYFELANYKWNKKAKDLYINKYMRFLDPYKPIEIFNLLISDKREDGYYQDYNNDGWVKSFTIPENADSALPSYLRVFDNNTVKREDIAICLKKVNEWKEEGIQIFGFRPPTTKAMESIEDSLSNLNFPDFKLEFEKHGGIWMEFPDENFRSYDGSHLHYESAIRFSKLIGERIKQKINSPKKD